MTENFISFVQVMEASTPFDDGPDVYTTIIGRMTGLDMSKYALVQARNLCGWYLVRKP